MLVLELEIAQWSMLQDKFNSQVLNLKIATKPYQELNEWHLIAARWICSQSNWG